MRIFSKVMAASFIAICAALPASGAETARTIEVDYGPGAGILAYPIAGGGVPPGFETVILHNISIFNIGGEAIRVSRVTIEASSNEETTGTLQINADKLKSSAASWARHQSLGRLKTHEPLFQIESLVKGRELAASPDLKPDSGLIIARTPMLVSSSADNLTIRVAGTSSDGESHIGELRVPIVRRILKNRFQFPLCGRWLLAIGPNLNGHHRWGAAQEFAVDVVRLGPDMRSHKGDGSQPEMFYAFGAPVLAAADGDVVTTADGLEDSESLQKPGESVEDFENRMAGQQERLIASGIRNLIGNHIMIRHPNGEYSLYAHLRSNSIRVRTGDHVAQGDVIAELGNSGASTEPHLHFSIHDGPDPIASRGVPMRFDGLSFWDDADGGTGTLNSGQVVETRGCEA